MMRKLVTNMLDAEGVPRRMNLRTLALAGLGLSTVAPGAMAQGVIVDEGQFAITLAGEPAGTEEFVIRRAGVGRDDAVFANGVVRIEIDGQTQEVRSLLRATPPDGIAESYQVAVSGPDAMEVRLGRSGRRYVSTIRSDVGAEDREFQAHGDTRVLERSVAHHYYFVRDLREGHAAHTLEPRTRGQTTLTAGARSEVELVLGPNVVSARRVVFTSEQGDDRIVWFDRQGRVLKVEIPALDYVAQRTDLVG